MLRTQSAIVHITTNFIREVNKKAVICGGKKEYAEVIQAEIMGKSKQEIRDLIAMLGATIPFIANTIHVLAEEIVEREKYE